MIDRQLKILVTEPERYCQEALDLYRILGTVTLGRPERSWLRSQIADVSILVVRLRVHVDAELLDCAGRLLAVVSPTTGLTHIDQTACRRRGITVLSLYGEKAFLGNVTATAEHTFGLILALLRGTVRAHQHVLGGGWNRDEFVGRELGGLTLGILGFGRLGSQMAKYANVFGVNVLIFDPYLDRQLLNAQSMTEVSLHEVLARSDIISIHVTHTRETHHLLGERELSRMRRGALLVNTSRGEVVDEAALLNALRSGHVGGVALDVIENEQDLADIAKRPIVKLARAGANVILTPHIGGCTRESMQKTEIFMAQKTLRFFNERVVNER